MDVNNMGQITLGTYFKEWWQNLPAPSKKRYWTALGLFSTIWLAGAVHAPTAVAGLARVEGIFRLLMALGMGGFSFLWRGLEAAGLIEETRETPNLLWLPLALLMPGAMGGFLYLLSQPPNPLFGIQKMLEKAARAQGRVEAEAVREKLAIAQGIPLVEVGDGQEKRLIGLDYAGSEGHVIVVAPTRAGKGLHLTDTLRHYPGPALVVDPKSEVRRAA